MDHPEKDSNGKDLPRYTSSQKVWALQIKEVHFFGPPVGNGAKLFFEGGYAPITVGSIFVNRFNFRAGGYWVRLEDGTDIYCPAELFELMFTRDKTPRRSEKKGAAKRTTGSDRQARKALFGANVTPRACE